MSRCAEGIGGENLAEALLKDTKTLEVPASAVLMVMLTIFLDTLSSAISGPVIPYYAKSFNAQIQSIGWLYASSSVSSFIFGPCLSRMADHWGRRPIILVSLLGAGTAGIIQGLANQSIFEPFGFYIFLFGRFFAGIWSATGGTCNIYLTDVCPEEVRAGYMAKLSAMPILATLFGPGLGGGMAGLGLAVPMLVDGGITLFTAGLVAMYLPETPTFLKTKMLQESSRSGESKRGKLSWKIYALCVADFLSSIAFMTLVSVFAIFMDERFHPFSALKVGFCQTYQAVVMLLTSIFAVPFLQSRMSTAMVAMFGMVINQVFLWIFPFIYNLPLALFLLGMSGIGFALVGATIPVLFGDFAEDHHRGRVFALLMMSSNLGAMVGPILATYLFQHFDLKSPFLVGAVLTLSSNIIFLCARRVPFETWKKKGEPPTPLTPLTPLGLGETGADADVLQLGKFMAKLLQRKGYKWISKREEVERLLDLFVPQLPEEQTTSYDQLLKEVIESESRLGRTAVRAFNP